MNRDILRKELEQNRGVLRLYPSWVLRDNLPPGRRLKLNIQDLYPYGLQRGAVCERWIASTARADNGEKTLENEGLSYIALNDGASRCLLIDAVAEMGEELVGKQCMEKFGGMRAFAKFYDFSIPIPHHVHLMEKDSRLVGVAPKPEAYFFPVQLNAVMYAYPHTYFGFEPGTTKEDIIRCLDRWGKFDGAEILQYAKAYRLKLGTGWDVPAGILHAPGSLVTYEPQYVSDTSLFFQPVVEDWYVKRETLVKFLPKDKANDLEYIVNVLDWEANTDPEFRKHHYHEPIPVVDEADMEEAGYKSAWIVYGSDNFSAKEITVLPGRSITLKEDSSFGAIVMNGRGKLNGVDAASPACIGYFELTEDEFFVTYDAARAGVQIENTSKTTPLVILINFGPENQEALALKARLEQQ